MSIEEEIKILENALSGALLVPSECAFVSTEIIKICLETLKTYESWELLIRHEIEKQIRAEEREKTVEFIINQIIFPLLNEYDISVWKNICYIKLADKWVEAVKNNQYPKFADTGKARKKYLKKWFIEQMKGNE